jgi:hypothetical protein
MKRGLLFGLGLLILSAVSPRAGETDLNFWADKYVNCVVKSFKGQIRAPTSTVNPATAAESSFLACRTEENAYFGLFAADFTSPARARVEFDAMKLGIKDELIDAVPQIRNGH